MADEILPVLAATVEAPNGAKREGLTIKFLGLCAVLCVGGIGAIGAIGMIHAPLDWTGVNGVREDLKAFALLILGGLINAHRNRA